MQKGPASAETALALPPHPTHRHGETPPPDQGLHKVIIKTSALTMSRNAGKKSNTCK